MMKITEDVRRYAAKQGIAEEETLMQGAEAKSLDSSRRAASANDFAWQKAVGQNCGSGRSQFVKKGAEVYSES